MYILKFYKIYLVIILFYIYNNINNNKMDLFKIFIIILLFLLGIYFIINLLKVNDKITKIILEQNEYISRISDLIELSDEKMKNDRLAEAFKSTDEVGFFFETLKEIQRNMNAFKLIK